MWRERLTRLFPALASIDGYVVGGAIRDLLLDRTPADADIACLDPLAAAQSLGRKVIRLGDHEHLSAYRVVLPEHVYDFAGLLDGDIDADLARRDFTINAMAVDLRSDTLLDPHGGQRDLAARVVRMVHAENFDDDPLRTLKGVRMAVKYDMTLDPATLEAIRLRAPKITTIAAERVMYELSVIFSSNAFRKAVELLHATGLDVPLGLQWSAAAPGGATSLAGAFALLVKDPATHAERWKWSDALLRDVFTLQRLIEHHDRIALFDAGELLARELAVMLPDEALDFPDFSIRALLTGDEIAKLTGLAPGADLGRLKRALLEAQVRGEVRARDEAERFVTVSA